MKNRILVSLLALTLMACSSEETTSSSPTVEKRPVTLELHGDTRVDDYY
jgi:uncharacterized protein YcfL